MRLVVSGSRSIDDYATVSAILAEKLAGKRFCGYPVTEIVEGGARGVDRLVARWARSVGFEPKEMLADWQRFPGRAGRIRNRQMVEYAAASPDGRGGFLAIWDGKSPGTEHATTVAYELGLVVVIRFVPPLVCTPEGRT